MGRVERDREIARKRSRRVKIKKLRARFEKATSRGERDEIMIKARKISPLISFEASEE